MRAADLESDQALGRIVAELRDGVLGSTPAERLVAAGSTSEFVEFIGQRRLDLVSANRVEQRRAAKRALAKLEALEERRRLDAELRRRYAGEHGLRSSDLTHIERREAQADLVASICDRLHGLLNPPLVDGEAPPPRFKCDYCPTEISREDWWHFGQCAECRDPKPRERDVLNEWLDRI